MNGSATQIASAQFDADLNRLPSNLRELVQAKLDTIGLRLRSYSHFRMAGSNQYRLRVGDYRVIYRFDIEENELYLLAIGHRREIYR
ncbi:MAG TPA: type II toxin-antitoxin system RelE/ParE family toxin [Verrucomicrobiae bacterium]|jgi:mRNA interferase RelE/StbE